VQPEGVPAPPDPATNNAFLYCLIDAALRCEVDVLLPCVMSNHYHAVIFDRARRYPEFIEHLHKLGLRSHQLRRRRAPPRIASAVGVLESFAAKSTTRV
jgi:hypothetical protein